MDEWMEWNGMEWEGVQMGLCSADGRRGKLDMSAFEFLAG